MKAVRAFKVAVIGALQADAGVTVLVGQAIYDVVPEKTQPPYIWLGPVGAQREADYCDVPVWRLRMRLYVASKKFGRDEAWNIIAAVNTALDGKAIAMPEGTSLVLPISTILGGDVVDPVSLAQTFLDLTATVAG